MLTFKAHAKPIYSLAFSPDGQYLATSSGDSLVRLWTLNPPTQIQELPGSSFAAPLDFSPDGVWLARGGGEGPACFKVADGSVLFSEPGVTEAIRFSPSGEELLAHGYSGTPLRRWAMPAGTPLPGGWGGTRGSSGLDQFPTGPAAFQPGSGRLAALYGRRGERGYASVFVFWDNQGQSHGELIGEFGFAHPTAMSFSPDGSLLAMNYGPRLAVWDVAAGKVVASRMPSKKHFKSLVFLPDGARIATVSGDANVSVWHALTCLEAGSWTWKAGALNCLAVDPSGCRLAAGGKTGKVVVWDEAF